METKRSDIFQSLLIDEEKMLEEVVANIKKVILLDRRGNLIFQVPRKDLNNKQLVGIYLLGRFVAFQLDIEDSKTLSAEEIANLTNVDSKSVRARLADLKKQLIVDSPERGQYEITIFGAKKLLDEVLSTNYEGDLK